MFGQNTTNQMVAGSPTAQNPSMLDNVTPQDFQTPPATAQPDPAQQPIQSYQPEPAPYQPPAAGTQDSTYSQTTATVPPQPEPQMQNTNTEQPAQDPMPFVGTSTSGPVDPPAMFGAAQPEPADEPASDPPQDTDSTASSVDHQKLADMKQEALDHLEPLAEHLDGTPEETFRTTMMMIQANDNHTLLEKALTAAKQIEDDKTRAQAMLDIINEINYFAQAGM